MDKEIVVSILFQPCTADIDLGFSIGGGVDEPLEEDDAAVYVIKVAVGDSYIQDTYISNAPHNSAHESAQNPWCRKNGREGEVLISC